MEQYVRNELIDGGDFPVRLNLSHGRYSETTQPLYHSDIEFHLMCQGRGQYFIQDRNYQLEKNCVVIIHKNEVHNYIADSQSNIKKICLVFSPNLLDGRKAGLEVISEMQAVHFLQLSERHATTAEMMLQSVAEELRTQPTYWQESIADHIEILLTMLHRAVKDESEKQALLDPEVQEVINYLDNNYAEGLTLPDLANHFCMSQYALSRRFKRYFGLGFKKYLIHRRVVEAKRLLEETDFKVARIASDVGFNNLSAFNRDFLALTGVNPSAFRNISS